METWAVFGSEDTTAIWVEDESGKRVCTMRNCETDLDRARLIADAPQTAADRDRLQALNAELVAILSKITRANDSGNNGSVMGEAMLCEAFAIEARSVLAKSKESR